MSYLGTAALQAAVYRVLREDAALHELVGDAIYDAMPVAAPAGPYVSLGPEEVRDAGDMTAAGAVHDFVVSVLSGAEAAGGFGAVKAAAVAVSEALETAELALMLGVEPGRGGAMTRDRLAELVARYPDRPAT
ncbi:phage tail assembly chaperone [Paracoccus sp. J39]|uniref:tail completion protein gp17 n=1 Tax=Paracoccus sp. J39 TaxID=935848 RepID=UPI0004ACC0FB|nr:phage tail assembly chaperone [Paracoccus sp. J39]